MINISSITIHQGGLAAALCWRYFLCWRFYDMLENQCWLFLTSYRYGATLVSMCCNNTVLCLLVLWYWLPYWIHWFFNHLNAPNHCLSSRMYDTDVDKYCFSTLICSWVVATYVRTFHAASLPTIYHHVEYNIFMMTMLIQMITWMSSHHMHSYFLGLVEIDHQL